MMSEEEKKPLSIIERMRQKTQQQKSYLQDKCVDKDAAVETEDCPNCGAGRAKYKGVTHCAYCGFEFIQTKLTDGIFIKKEDNSKD